MAHKRSDSQRYRDAIRWCQYNHLSLAGLPFLDEIDRNGGVKLQLITPPFTSNTLIKQALEEAYLSREVVGHRVIECPLKWFM